MNDRKNTEKQKLTKEEKRTKKKELIETNVLGGAYVSSALTETETTATYFYEDEDEDEDRKKLQEIENFSKELEGMQNLKSPKTKHLFLSDIDSVEGIKLGSRSSSEVSLTSRFSKKSSKAGTPDQKDSPPDMRYQNNGEKDTKSSPPPTLKKASSYQTFNTNNGISSKFFEHPSDKKSINNKDDKNEKSTSCCASKCVIM